MAEEDTNTPATDAENQDLSGAPDKPAEPGSAPPQSDPLNDPIPATVPGIPTTPAQPEKKGEIVWDENNTLVHPKLNDAAVLAHKVALGEMSREEAGMTGAAFTVPSFDSPEKAQQAESQTADPTTSPQPIRMNVTEPLMGGVPDNPDATSNTAGDKQSALADVVLNDKTPLRR